MPYTTKWKDACHKLIAAQVALGMRPPPGDLPCDKRCGRMGQAYHHPDYDQPEYVVAMCRPCHQRLHDVEMSWRGHAAKARQRQAEWERNADA